MNLNYLFTPIESTVEPPISTNLQELPIEDLSWEDFEKLCLAMVQIEFSIDDCEIYGRKGQAQEGIDIFARQLNGKYSSYQCKKYQKFDCDDLNKAVDYFKEKKFYSQSDKLHICTSCEWNKTQVQDRFEELKTSLQSDGIKLIKWDKIQISRYLKERPQLVYDFFGAEWVKRFNGEVGLRQISKSKKFDAVQVAVYRKELYEFYSAIFNIQDPGIPIKEINHPYNIQDRFILPDILSNVNTDNWENTLENPNQTNQTTFVPIDRDLKLYQYNDYSYDENELLSRLKRNKINETHESNSTDIRIKIDEALTGNNKNIIIGDPGAGKSTLLRYIVLDILSPKPKLANISQQFGRLLPVWLPFAFITKHLSYDDTLSISEILKLWFKSFDKVHLFEVAKDALIDDRLFLIIDGIDEWNNIASAQLALRKIETTRSLFDCKVLYSSRPYGFRILRDSFTNLKVLNLAGFSKPQQKEFIEKWYSKWAALQSTITDPNFAKRQSEYFVKELGQTGDLNKLAETPLLLSILIIQKIRDSILPKNKLEALKEITQYLIHKHPAKRGMDAGIVQDMADDIDYKEIFCELAIHIQVQSNDGVIQKNDAQKAIENYLIRYADYDKAKAKLRSRELIDVGANNFGIIIEKSIDEIAFSHKQFQEFLSAQYLFESDEELTCGFIKNHGADPAFHQVIINLFGLIPQKQIMRYQKFFDLLKAAERKKYEENYLTLIAYEVAINIENAPTEILTKSFEAIIRDFEFETDTIFKEALLKRILAALYNSRLKEKVQQFLLQFFPNHIKYRDYRIENLKEVELLMDSQVEFLKKILINGTLRAKHNASYALRKHITLPEIFNFINNLILDCQNPEILSFAINSIITTDVEKEKIDQVLSTVTDSSTLVRLFLYKYKVFTKEQTDDDLEEILHFINDVSYELKNETINLLIDGFGRSQKLIDRLLLSVRNRESYRRDSNIDPEIAWKVLFHCFNNDPRVISRVNEEFEEEYPFSTADSHSLFSFLIVYFKGKEKQIPAVENWLSKRLEKYKHIDNEVAYASVFMHTDAVKKSILEDLPFSGVSHWHVSALLEGWPGDKTVISELKEYFRTSDVRKTSAAAYSIPKVFENEKIEAIDLLEKILFEGKVIFRERAIAPLVELDREYFENKILDRLLEDIGSFSKDEFFNSYHVATEEILKNFHTNATVKSFVLEKAYNDSDLFAIASPFYPELDIDFKALKKSLPLSMDLRRIIIAQLNDLPTLPANIESEFNKFSEEGEEEIKADMAVCLFNHLKQTNTDKIIELSYPFVFGRGFDYEIQRNIGFTGYLIARRLDEYLQLEDSDSSPGEKAHPAHIFTGHRAHRSTSTLMLNSLIDNFEYLISITKNNFKTLLGSSPSSIEEVWGFFAHQSSKSSPSYPYIMQFISDNVETIRNKNLISFLNRTSPESSTLRSVLLRLLDDPKFYDKAFVGRLLGLNFKNDPLVYKVVSSTGYEDEGKVVALCNGWPNDPLLKSMFQEIIDKGLYVNYHVSFNLKFLFRDIDNLIGFLKQGLANPNEIFHYHRHFLVPMIERLRRDGKFRKAVLDLLISSTTIDEKISYYNMLSQVNMISDETRQWINQIGGHNNYGYDIVSNKRIRLKDILYDFYF